MKFKKYYMIRHSSEKRTFLDGMIAGVVLVATAWTLYDIRQEIKHLNKIEAEEQAWLETEES